MSTATYFFKQGAAVEMFHRVLPDGSCSCGLDKCKRPGKHPILFDGKRRKFWSVEEFIPALKANPSANLALVCGRESGFVVVDRDDRYGGKENLQGWLDNYADMPPTIRYRSQGGGVNRIYKYPKLANRKFHGHGITEGVEVLADGRSALLPPSTGKDGASLWIKGAGPGSIEIPDFPEAYIEVVTSEDTPPPPPPGASALVPAAHSIPDGQRNTKLASVAGSFHRQGFSSDKVLELVLIANSQLCDVPLDEDEVRQIVNSICKLDGGSSTISLSDPADWLAQKVLTEVYHNGDHLVWVLGRGFMAYTSQLWKPLPESELRYHLNRIIDSLPAAGRPKKTLLLAPTVEILKAKCASPAAQAMFGQPSNLVMNCLNGELHIGWDGNIDFLPHSPQSYLTHLMPVSYDPAATAPVYEEAVREIFSLSPAPEDYCLFINELAGMVVSGWRLQPIIAIFLGGGSNGKTFFSNLMTRMMGHDAVYSAHVRDLAINRFAVGALVGKKLFLDDDVGANERLPDEILKKISESKILTGEKKFQDQFSFVCQAIPLLLCNHLPMLSDLSYGMRRRLVTVPFDRRFTPKEQDPRLLETIVANEAAGVLNLWLAGLQRLIKRGRLALPKSIRETNERLVTQANPLATFLDARCEKKKGSRIGVPELYVDFVAWADQEGVLPGHRPTKNRVKNDLIALGHTVQPAGGGKVFLIDWELKNY